nr:Chain E, NEMO peptide [Homo sapiens]7T2U_F Chain F, NEMO peptide [Homo sapiens]
KLAQLQVAYH